MSQENLMDGAKSLEPAGTGTEIGQLVKLVRFCSGQLHFNKSIAELLFENDETRSCQVAIISTLGEDKDANSKLLINMMSHLLSQMHGKDKNREEEIVAQFKTLRLEQAESEMSIVSWSKPLFWPSKMVPRTAFFFLSIITASDVRGSPDLSNQYDQLAGLCIYLSSNVIYVHTGEIKDLAWSCVGRWAGEGLRTSLQKSHQKLTMLIKDSIFANEFLSGDRSGVIILNDFLKQTEDKTKKLTTCFLELTCFVLPSFTAKFFAKNFDKFLATIFDPCYMDPKIISGNPVCPSEICEMIDVFTSAIEYGAGPSDVFTIQQVKECGNNLEVSVAETIEQLKQSARQHVRSPIAEQDQNEIQDPTTAAVNVDAQEIQIDKHKVCATKAFASQTMRLEEYLRKMSTNVVGLNNSKSPSLVNVTSASLTVINNNVNVLPYNAADIVNKYARPSSLTSPDRKNVTIPVEKSIETGVELESDLLSTALLVYNTAVLQGFENLKLYGTQSSQELIKKAWSDTSNLFNDKPTHVVTLFRADTQTINKDLETSYELLRLFEKGLKPTLGMDKLIEFAENFHSQCERRIKTIELKTIVQQKAIGIVGESVEKFEEESLAEFAIEILSKYYRAATSNQLPNPVNLTNLEDLHQTVTVEIMNAYAKMVKMIPTELYTEYSAKLMKILQSFNSQLLQNEMPIKNEILSLGIHIGMDQIQAAAFVAGKCVKIENLGDLKGFEFCNGMEFKQRSRLDLFKDLFVEHVGKTFQTNWPDGIPKVFRVEELLAILLSELKKRAEHQFGQSLQNCGIAILTNFNKVQEQAVLDAAQIAGFARIEILSETSAAATSYAMEPDSKTPSKLIVVVGNELAWDVGCYRYKVGQLSLIATSSNARVNIDSTEKDKQRLLSTIDEACLLAGFAQETAIVTGRLLPSFPKSVKIRCEDVLVRGAAILAGCIHGNIQLQQLWVRSTSFEIKKWENILRTCDSNAKVNENIHKGSNLSTEKLLECQLRIRKFISMQ